MLTAIKNRVLKLLPIVSRKKNEMLTAIRLLELQNDYQGLGLAVDYEAKLERIYSKIIEPGDGVIDIGAHAGRHLRSFIRLVGQDGHVLGFEPLPDKFDFLESHFVEKNLNLFNVALSNEQILGEYIVNDSSPEESGLKRRIYNTKGPQLTRQIKVKVDKLDHYNSFINKKIKFIKIDIEGGELNCLAGAQEIIESYRPVISVEYGFSSYSVYGHEKNTLFEYCIKNDYFIYDIFLNKIDSIELWGTACDSIYWDYILIPVEREDEIINTILKNSKKLKLN